MASLLGLLPKISEGLFSVLVFAVSAIVQRDQEVIRDFLPRYFFRVFFISNLLNFFNFLSAWYRARPHGGGRAA